MSTDIAFFDATLAQLAQLPVQRSVAPSARLPAGARYPPPHVDFQMPPIKTSSLASAEREDYFSLTFKTLKAPARKFTLHTSSVRTVAQVKRHLARVSNIPAAHMRLVLNGKGLVDGKLIGDYAIHKDSVIQVITKAAGASPPTPLPEADELEVIDNAAEEANPLSSALGRDAAKARRLARKDLCENMIASEASTDDESSVDVMSPTTAAQLRQPTSTFRNNLRELIHGQFGRSQAGAVDRLLDSYFATL